MLCFELGLFKPPPLSVPVSLLIISTSDPLGHERNQKQECTRDGVDEKGNHRKWRNKRTTCNFPRKKCLVVDRPPKSRNTFLSATATEERGKRFLIRPPTQQQVLPVPLSLFQELNKVYFPLFCRKRTCFLRPLSLRGKPSSPGNSPISSNPHQLHSASMKYSSPEIEMHF